MKSWKKEFFLLSMILFMVQTAVFGDQKSLSAWMLSKDTDGKFIGLMDQIGEVGGIVYDDTTGNTYVTINGYITSFIPKERMRPSVYEISATGEKKFLIDLPHVQVGSMVIDNGYLYLGYIKMQKNGSLRGLVERIDLQDTDGTMIRETVWESTTQREDFYAITTLLKKDGYLYINDYSNQEVIAVNLANINDKKTYIDFNTLGFEDVYGIAFDKNGTLYGTEYQSGRLIQCKQRVSCQVVLENPESTTDTTTPKAAISGMMSDVKIDPEGNIYISYIDYNSPSGIFKYTPDMQLDTSISKNDVSTFSMYMSDSGMLITGDMDIILDEYGDVKNVKGDILKMNTISNFKRMASGTSTISKSNMYEGL